MRIWEARGKMQLLLRARFSENTHCRNNGGNRIAAAGDVNKPVHEPVFQLIEAQDGFAGIERIVCAA